ncbi:MAG: leucine-rich repeat domain-containing protein [Christensenellales bacterium]
MQEGNDRIMMQDGFSAPVDSVPRPRFSSACAMVGRHVMDFSDNGDGTLTAVRCIDRQADDLDIQFEAGACPVVAIAPRAFEGCAALRRVILPESLRQIGEMAFSGCSHLRLLTIPGGVQRVGTLAFAKCSQLERVRIEPGVVQLGPSCFSKCAALKRVEMPASVTQIGGARSSGAAGAEALRRGGCARGAVRPAQRADVRFPELEGRRGARAPRGGGRHADRLGARQTAPHRIEIPTEICGRRVAAIAPKAFLPAARWSSSSWAAAFAKSASAFFGCRQLVSVSFERGLEQLTTLSPGARA